MELFIIVMVGAHAISALINGAALVIALTTNIKTDKALQFFYSFCIASAISLWGALVLA